MSTKCKRSLQRSLIEACVSLASLGVDVRYADVEILTWEQLKALKKRFWFKHHPDKNHSPDATENFQRGQEAFAAVESRLEQLLLSKRRRPQKKSSPDTARRLKTRPMRPRSTPTPQQQQPSSQQDKVHTNNKQAKTTAITTRALSSTLGARSALHSEEISSLRIWHKLFRALLMRARRRGGGDKSQPRAHWRHRRRRRRMQQRAERIVRAAVRSLA